MGLFLGFMYTEEWDSILSLFMFLIYIDKGYWDTDFAAHYEILTLAGFPISGIFMPYKIVEYNLIKTCSVFI